MPAGRKFEDEKKRVVDVLLVACCLHAWHDGWVVDGMNEEYSHHVFDVRSAVFLSTLVRGFPSICVTFEIVSYLVPFLWCFIHAQVIIPYY